MYFRRAYAGEAAQKQDDAGSYAASHLTEILPTAMIYRSGNVINLENMPMPEIASVVATPH